MEWGLLDGSAGIFVKQFKLFESKNKNVHILYNIFRRSLNKSVVDRKDVKQQLDDLEDHRPFFTYWVTVVQILVLFLSIFSYGLGPFGIDLSHQSGAVSITILKYSYMIRNVCVNVLFRLWSLVYQFKSLNT